MTDDVILWASADPDYKTGYGRQTAIWAKKLHDEGRRIEIASMGGLRGVPREWHGIKVWPVQDFMDLIALYKHRRANLLIGLRDFWDINTDIMGQAELRSAFWMPIDCDPLDISDFTQINASHAYPIAMSRFGTRMLRQAGIDQFLYVPHGIDVGFWTPAAESSTETAREAQAIPPDVFVIGINATNSDALRKGWYEQLAAFEMFHRQYPDSLLLMHTLTQDEGANLEYMSFVLGIEEAVGTSHQWMLKQGLISDHILREWYRSIHLLSNCSWGEGFGIPIIEAQACGVPVVVTDFSSMSELVGPGWLVDGELKWNATHNGRWKAPFIGGIYEAYEAAYLTWKQQPNRWHNLRLKARKHAEKYDVDRVYELYWRPALDALFKGRTVIYEAAGLKWMIDIDTPSSDGLGAAHEAAVEQVVLSLIPKGGVFLDVGAHVGHYSLRAAKIASKVIAVEAMPDTADRLRENIALNDIYNITVHNIAAWDEAAALGPHSETGAIRDGSTRLLPETGGPVQGIPLDGPLKDEPRIDVIKLDVEGSDLHALRGMRDLIFKHRPVMFIEDHSIYGYYDRKDLEALVTELGYEWTDAADFGGTAPYLICRPT